MILKFLPSIKNKSICLEDLTLPPGFGRNAEQNQHLSFKIAHDEDTFLHIHDYSGAHVIIFKQNPNEEELLIGAELAIYLSKKVL